MTDKGETTVLEGEFEEAAPGPAPGRAKRPRRRLLRWLPWSLVLLLASFIGGLFAAPEIEQRLIAWGLMSAPPAPSAPAMQTTSADDAGPDVSLEPLRSRLDTVESALSDIGAETGALAQTLARLDDRLAQQGAPATGMSEDAANRLAEMEARLDALTGRLADTKAAQAGRVAPEELENLTRAINAAGQARARLESELAAVKRRLATLEAVNRTGSVASTLYRDLIALHRRVDAGQPYGPALQAVRLQVDSLPAVLRAGAASALATLADHAGNGAPTRQALAAAFPDIARRLQQAAAAPGTETEEGWFDRFRSSFASIVVVRPDGPAAGSDLPAILARAEAAVTAGQLDAAQAELNALPAATLDAVPAARRWMNDLRARLAVERAIESLLAALASDGSTAAGEGS